jgi:hypothetical protein
MQEPIGTNLATLVSELTSNAAKALEELRHLTEFPSASAIPLSSVDVPEELSSEIIIEALEAKKREFSKRAGEFIAHANLEEGIDPEEIQVLNPMAEQMEDGTYKLTPAKMQDYMSFIETIKSVDIDSLQEKSQEELQALGLKLGYLYLNTLKGKSS